MKIFNKIATINYSQVFWACLPWLILGVMFFSVWLLIKPYLPGYKEQSAEKRNYVFYQDQQSLSPATWDSLKLKEVLFTKVNLQDKSIKKIQASSKSDLSKIISQAEADQIIVLAHGEYKINLAINKKITIVGSGADTIIRARDNKKPIFSVNNAEFILENLELADSRIGVIAEGSSLSITGVKLSNLAATAIYGDNSRLSLNGAYIYQAGSAVKAKNCQGEIINSIISGSQKSGVELLNGSNFQISGNAITSNQSYGIFADITSQAEVANNYISGNAGYEVRLEKTMEIYN